MQIDEKILETGIMFYLPISLKEKIKNEAHEERLNQSEFIRKVLSNYIDSKNGGDK